MSYMSHDTSALDMVAVFGQDTDHNRTGREGSIAQASSQPHSLPPAACHSEVCTAQSHDLTTEDNCCIESQTSSTAHSHLKGSQVFMPPSKQMTPSLATGEGQTRLPSISEWLPIGTVGVNMQHDGEEADSENCTSSLMGFEPELGLHKNRILPLPLRSLAKDTEQVLRGARRDSFEFYAACRMKQKTLQASFSDKQHASDLTIQVWNPNLSAGTKYHGVTCSEGLYSSVLGLAYCSYLNQMNGSKESESIKQCQAIAVSLYGSVYKPNTSNVPFKLLEVYGCCMEHSEQMKARGLEQLSVCGRKGLLAHPGPKGGRSEMQSQGSVSESSEVCESSAQHISAGQTDHYAQVLCPWLATVKHQKQYFCSKAHCRRSIVIPRQDEPMPYWGTRGYNARTFEHIRTRPWYKHPISLTFPQEHLGDFDTATLIGSNVGYKRNQQDGSIDFWVKDMCDSVGNVLSNTPPGPPSTLIIQMKKYLGEENQVLLQSISTSFNLTSVPQNQGSLRHSHTKYHPATACCRSACDVVAFHSFARSALCSRHYAEGLDKQQKQRKKRSTSK